MERSLWFVCPGSQKTFCAVEVGNSGEKKISHFQCVVVIVVPELSMKGRVRQEDLRMLQCLGVDGKARGRQKWNFGCRGARQQREGSARGSLTDPQFLSEEDLSWNGPREDHLWRLKKGYPSVLGARALVRRPLVRARGVCRLSELCRREMCLVLVCVAEV